MDEEITKSKSPDEIFCPECGKTVKKDAVVCINCGVQLKELKVSQPYQPTQQIQTPRPSPVSPLSIDDILKEGNFQLRGIRGFYWFSLVFYTIAYISAAISLIFSSIYSLGYPGYFKSVLIIIAVVYVVILALHILPLIGIIKRKPFSVPFTRAILILSMFINFPIGTIIGGVVWKRINHSSAKKYLNY